MKKPQICKYLVYLIFLLLGAYVITKSYVKGNDINVYLHAAQEFISGGNPYIDNPFNKYLYSPFFTVLLAPLTYLGFPLARVAWALLNCFLLFRSWQIFEREILSQTDWSQSRKNLFAAVALLLSFNAFNHNLILGQMTVFMLWTVIESMYQIRKGNLILGTVILALGINIKIIPILGLIYLFFKGRIKALVWTGSMLLLMMVIPMLFTGWENNILLHTSWFEAINPSGSKFGLEVNDGCVSVNCLLSRTTLDAGLQKLLTNAIRLILLSLFLYRIFKSRANPSITNAWREWSMILMGILLIFPHQMKYTMLFIVPAAIYFLFEFFNTWTKDERIMYGLPLGICFILPAIIGRDLIGNAATNFFDTIGLMGIFNLIIFLFLIFYVQRNEAPIKTDVQASS